MAKGLDGEQLIGIIGSALQHSGVKLALYTSIRCLLSVSGFGTLGESNVKGQVGFAKLLESRNYILLRLRPI